jgi:predicted Fe-Mo cluster-binding NifX family protein
MIVIISSQGGTLESKPNPHFGRSPFFIRYDVDKESWQAFENPAVNEPGGAGVSASQFAVDHQASAVISGRFGPNAYRVLNSAGIQMFVFDPNCESVREAIKAFTENTLLTFEH